MAKYDEAQPAGPLCVLQHRPDPDGNDIPRLATSGHLCTGHRNGLDSTLIEIGNLLIDFARVREPGSAPRDSTPRTGRTKNPSPPIPVNMDYLILMDPRSSDHPTYVTPRFLRGYLDVDPDADSNIVKNPDDRENQPRSITDITRQQCLMLIEGRPLMRIDSATGKRRPIPVPQSIVARLDLLQRHHDWLAGSDQVGDYWLDMTAVRKSLKAAVRDQPWRKRGNCYLQTAAGTACNGALLQENGSDVVKCNQCKTAWVTPQQLRHLALGLGAA